MQKLIAINHQFYQQFAGEFDATRQRLQPGVIRLLDGISPEARVLDLGCGNGQLWRELARQGHRARYVGVDFSDGLLDVARHGTDSAAGVAFHQRDLSTPEWDADLPVPFDVIAAFAVFHHLPPALLPEILRKTRGLLTPDGRLLLSCWQFLNSDHWRARIQPWERAGLVNPEPAPGDYLLDWRRGGVGYRYVHHYSPDELAGLAGQTGFVVAEMFYSDGAEGNLGLYQVWRL